MNSSAAAIVLTAIFAISTAAMGACHNTYEGAKADTSNAVEATGEGVRKAGTGIEHAGEKLADGGK
jgi:hypothetical protein